MKALCWQGEYGVTVDGVPDPRDAIVRASTAISGPDLHLYDGFVKPWSREGCGKVSQTSRHNEFCRLMHLSLISKAAWARRSL